MDEAQAKAFTRRWVEKVVVGLNLCPFARPALGGLTIEVLRGADPGDLVLPLVDALNALVAAPEDAPATTLLVLLDGAEDFEAYLDRLALAEGVLAQVGLEGRVQIASFHPDYCFEDVPADDPSNATNRSPLPTLHLIREADISAAVARHPNPAAIPERNAALARELGHAALRALWADPESP